MDTNPEPSGQYRPDAQDLFLYRHRASSQNLFSGTSSSHRRCADCGMPLEWAEADLTFGVELCKPCARTRRVSPPVRNVIDLANRLMMIEINMKNEVRTALALLEGTEYEEESKEWAASIMAALEAPRPGGPASTIVSMIAQIRKKFFQVEEVD